MANGVVKLPHEAVILSAAVKAVEQKSAFLAKDYPKYTTFVPVNSQVKLKTVGDTEALVTSIEIYGDTRFDVWYSCRWFIDGKPVSDKFLEHELTPI